MVAPTFSSLRAANSVMATENKGTRVKISRRDKRVKSMFMSQFCAPLFENEATVAPQGSMFGELCS